MVTELSNHLTSFGRVLCWLVLGGVSFVLGLIDYQETRSNNT